MLEDVAADATETPPTLCDPEAFTRLTEELVARAWRRHGIRRGTAEDLAQAAFIAFWQTHLRYPVAEEHGAILSGIFRHMCLHHVRGAQRERTRLQRYCTDPDRSRENPWLRPPGRADRHGVLEEFARRDARREIVAAIERLSPQSRRIAELITQSGMDRRALIEYFGVNPNTLDSRLRSCRIELRRMLRGNDLSS